MKQVCPFQEANKTEAKMLAETFEFYGLPLSAELPDSLFVPLLQ
jgi:hypothetical protein